MLTADHRRKTMGFKTVLICFLWIDLCSLVNSQNELKLVNVFFRHGARSPSNPYPTDPYKDLWPQGLDQLTTVGMQQTYDLGSFLKSLYIDTGFIEARYNPKQIYVRSTDFDRAMMSAYCALTSMFPPGLAEDQMFNVQLGWQSIPVHTEPLEDDKMLNMDGTGCPKYNKLQSDFYQTEEFSTFNNSYEEFYADLKIKSGQTGNPSPYTAWNVYDTYLCEITNGLTPPAWNTEEMMDTIVKELIPFQYVIDFGTLEKAKLKGGLMVDQIIRNMEAIQNGNQETKMFLYSGHDDNLILLLMAMNLYDYTYLTYTSTLIYELYQSPEGAKVKVLYKNNSLSEPSTLTIPGCTELCPLETFTNLVSDFRVTQEQWPQLCSLEEQSSGFSVALALGIAVVVMVILAVVLYVFLRQKPKKKYKRLNNHDVSRGDGNNDVMNERTVLVQSSSSNKPSTSYS